MNVLILFSSLNVITIHWHQFFYICKIYIYSKLKLMFKTNVFIRFTSKHQHHQYKHQLILFSMIENNNSNNEF